MISWATVRDGNSSADAEPEDGQTEEAVLHGYRSRYEKALNLILAEQLNPSREMLLGILSDMDSSRFKDVYIRFLALASLSRVYEKEKDLNNAYAAILRAVELNPGDVNSVSRAAWLASRLGDTWTARAFLNSDAFRNGGLVCLETAVLDGC